MISVKCADGKTLKMPEVKCIGSVVRVRDRAISKPPRVGEFPVCVEQSGNYRMFTYSKKIVSVA